MYDHQAEPFDGEETVRKYKKRMRNMHNQSMAHMDRWAAYTHQLDEVPDATQDFADAALRRARLDLDTYDQVLSDLRKRQDPRPEDARRQWLYKKGPKGLQ